MSSDGKPSPEAIWNVRDLVGDLADEKPLTPPASRTPDGTVPATARSTDARTSGADAKPAGPRAGAAPDSRGLKPGPVTQSFDEPIAGDAEPPRRGGWVSAEAMPEHVSGSSMRTVTLLAGIALLAVLAVAVAVAAANADDRPASSSSDIAQQEPSSPPLDENGSEDGQVSEEPTSTATEVADPEEEALSALRDLHSQDLPTVTFEGRYAAQLASKTVGIVDPNQVAANGSHTFYARDILAEHNRLRQGFTGETRVVLLLSTDYGRQQVHDGQPLWVTFALLPVSSREDVAAWCATQFPSISGAALENQCVPRRLNPPGTTAP